MARKTVPPVLHAVPSVGARIFYAGDICNQAKTGSVASVFRTSWDMEVEVNWDVVEGQPEHRTTHPAGSFDFEKPTPHSRFRYAKPGEHRRYDNTVRYEHPTNVD